VRSVTSSSAYNAAAKVIRYCLRKDKIAIKRRASS
jgi:hypothetical protein